MLQIIKFGIVGVIASFVDIGVLLLLKELFSVEILYASAISFCIIVPSYNFITRKIFLESNCN